MDLPGKFLISEAFHRRAAVLFGLALLLAATAAAGAARTDTESLVRSLRARARTINGFEAELRVRAGGSTQTGRLLFLAPDRVHMELKVSGLGDQKIISDGRTLWTITPQAKLATKIDLEALQKSWHRPLPNQATAIRDIFEVMKPGTARYVKDERVGAIPTRLFEGVPEIGVQQRRGATLPDHVRAWVGEDGLLRRQILLKGTEILMEATFRVTDTNPHIGPGLFRFDPPADYQVQDLTQSTLQTLRSLASG